GGRERRHGRWRRRNRRRGGSVRFGRQDDPCLDRRWGFSGICRRDALPSRGADRGPKNILPQRSNTVVIIGKEPERIETKMTIMSRPKRGVPEGLWIRCPQCKATIFRKEAESRFNVCPECQYHFYLPARDRIRQLLDQDSFEEWF